MLVTGGRDYMRPNVVAMVLDGLKATYPDLVVIEGGAPGADRFAAEWAEANLPKGNHEQFKADWAGFGKAAGMKRNAQMLAEGKPDLVIGFKDGFNRKLDKGGTENCIKQANELGIPAYIVERIS